MKYQFFLDETGDHGLTFIDKNFPLFLLCGCLLREDDLRVLEEKIDAFKQKYFKTTEVVLHSREIRKCEGVFQILFDLKLKEHFYQDLNDILKNTDFIVFGVGINKDDHIRKYGNQARDPYSISFSFIIERMVFCLDGMDKAAAVEMKAELRGKKEDSILLAHYNSIFDRGTYHVNSDRLRQRIKRFGFYSKRENVIGLQVADLIAYPLARHLLNPKEPYLPFNVIKGKIYHDSQGKFEGWGLKMFP